MKLSQLEPGQSGIIKEFTDVEMSIKLMEMGCLPGEPIRVSGYQLSLRKLEASTIILR